MNESITRAAGARHGQETAPQRMTEIIRGAHRIPRERTTLYGEVSEERHRASLAAAPLAEVINTPLQPRVHVAAVERQ